MSSSVPHSTAMLLRHRSALAAGTLLASPLAWSHHAMGGATPTTFFEGLLSGLAHPVIGADHFAFLIVTALLAASLQGVLRLLVPLAFVVATVFGTLYHVTEASLPMTEMVIALSALLGGITVLLRKGSVPAMSTGALLAAIGVFHGYAYGESIIGAEQTPLLSYLIGFALVQYAIILGGMQTLGWLAKRSEQLRTLAVRIGGTFSMLIGALFLGLSFT